MNTTTLPMPIAAGTHRASATLADFPMTAPRLIGIGCLVFPSGDFHANEAP
jgi:hypothetical protein